MTATQTPMRPTSAVVAGNPWRPTWSGTVLVARIELLRRRPTRKGYIFYGILLGLILLIAGLASASAGPGKNSIPLELILVMILGTGYLIGPSLAATAINGDSSEGVLAPMQMTRLTAGDLALGKLMATWGITLVAVATTIPFQWYAFTRSGWTFVELLTVLGVILFLVLMGTAVGLAWSSLAARNAVSVAMTHVTTGFFGLGTLIVFAFTTPLVSEDVTISVTQRAYDTVTDEQWNDPNFDLETLPCVTTEETRQWSHADRTAWLFLINPVVVIGESSPIIDPINAERDGRAAPGVFALMHQGTADVSDPDPRPLDEDWCAYPDYGTADGASWEQQEQANAIYPRAPWLGLGFHALLGLAAMTLTVRRLRVPYKTLRAGTRVA